MRDILLTGATGFVGARLQPLLVGRGFGVRCLTRDARRAAARFPERRWVEADVGDPQAMTRALAGCSAAYYLVHQVGAGRDFAQREAAAARTFADAAAAASIERIVYLGGVLAEGAITSEHLRSRSRVGAILMNSRVPALELRASMIVGYGSLSFLIVRDLAARLPFMILPRWLDSRTEPVAIDDVLLALDRALDIALPESRSFDLPGPEILSGREILICTAAALGLREPAIIRVPVLTPRLSSLWVRFVTGAEWSVAREIVIGLTTDLLARDSRYWELIGNPPRLPFGEAARCAIAEERQASGGGWSMVETLVRRFRAQRVQ